MRQAKTLLYTIFCWSFLSITRYLFAPNQPHQSSHKIYYFIYILMLSVYSKSTFSSRFSLPIIFFKNAKNHSSKIFFTHKKQPTLSRLPFYSFGTFMHLLQIRLRILLKHLVSPKIALACPLLQINKF